VYDTKTGTLSEGTPLPLPRGEGITGVWFRDRFVIAGGSLSRNIDYFDRTNSLFVTRKDLLIKERINPQLSVYGNKLYVFGGDKDASAEVIDDEFKGSTILDGTQPGFFSGYVSSAGNEYALLTLSSINNQGNVFVITGFEKMSFSATGTVDGMRVIPFSQGYLAIVGGGKMYIYLP